MDVDKNLISHVQQLARLQLTDEEVSAFVDDFQEVLRVFDVLQDADIPADTPITIHPAVDDFEPLRSDEPGGCLTQEQALSYTDDSQDGFFVGPRANK